MILANWLHSWSIAITLIIPFSITATYADVGQQSDAVVLAQANVEANQTSSDRLFWESIKDTKNPEEFKAYLNEFPNGAFAALARIRLKSLETAGAQTHSGGPGGAGASSPLDMSKLRPGAVFKDCSDCPEMVVVPPGSFQMGSERSGARSLPVHVVTFKNAYALAKTELTQIQWRAVMGSDPPRLAFPHCDDCPVERVSWSDAQEFLRRLNQKTGKTYRLPSEAEWEYACRAGGNYAYCGGANGRNFGWFSPDYGGDGGGNTNRVAQKLPNAWGLHDMSGNVWEWVADCFTFGYEGAPSDGRPREDGECKLRIIRGGGWSMSPLGYRGAPNSTDRDSLSVDDRMNYCGFRIARALP